MSNANGGTEMMQQLMGLRNSAGSIMIVMVATVVTWGLIDTIRKELFQPWLISEIGLDDTQIHFPHDQIADLGAVYSICITWAILMIILAIIIVVWYVVSKHGAAVLRRKN